MHGYQDRWDERELLTDKFDGWSETETAYLRKYWRRGYVDRQIADLLPSKTYNQVKKYRQKLGLKGHSMAREHERGDLTTAQLVTELADRKRDIRACDILLRRLQEHHPNLDPRRTFEAAKPPKKDPPVTEKPPRHLHREVNPVTDFRTTQVYTATEARGGQGRQILAEVARHHGLKVSDLVSHSRPRNITRARQEAYYRIRNETTLSLTTIGNLVDKDHTSVLHGIRAHAERYGLPIPGEGK